MGLFKSPEEKRLIELQKLIYNTDSSRLLKAPDQIYGDAATFLEVQSDLMNRVADGLESSESPRSFFRSIDNLRAIISRIRKLAVLYPEACVGLEANLEDTENAMEDMLPSAIDGLLDIWWDKARSEASLSNYESDRYDRMKLFFEEMDAYSDRMFPQNRLHLERLRKIYI